MVSLKCTGGKTTLRGKKITGGCLEMENPRGMQFFGCDSIKILGCARDCHFQRCPNIRGFLHECTVNGESLPTNRGTFYNFVNGKLVSY